MKIQSLQILRAFAAWLVVYHHYMQMFYNFESDSSVGYFFSKHGAFGVDIFFVLSGYVMFNAATRASVDGWSFFLKRLFRVFPAYWFFSFILIIFSFLMPEEFKFATFTIDSLVRSLLFIPNENPSGLGIYPLLTVGWTLNYEILFYTTLALCIFINKKHAVYLCCILVLSFPIVFEATESVIFSVLKSIKMWQFIFGMSVGWLHSKANIHNSRYIPLGVLLIISAIILFFVGDSLTQRTLSATMIVIGFISINNAINESYRITKTVIRLGDYSYSTYLCHIIVLGAFLNLFGNNLDLPFELASILGISIIIHITSSYSYRNIENSNIVLRCRDYLINIKYTH